MHMTVVTLCVQMSTIKMLLIFILPLSFGYPLLDTNTIMSDQDPSQNRSDFGFTALELYEKIYNCIFWPCVGFFLIILIGAVYCCEYINTFSRIMILCFACFTTARLVDYEINP